MRYPPGSSAPHLPHTPRRTLRSGVRGQRGSPGREGGCCRTRALRSSPLLSYSRRLFRFGVTLNCRRSHVSCLLPCQRGVRRAPLEGPPKPQTPWTPKQWHCRCHRGPWQWSHSSLLCHGPRLGVFGAGKKQQRNSTRCYGLQVSWRGQGGCCILTEKWEKSPRKS